MYDSVIQAQSGLVANQTGVNDESPRFLRQAAADKVTAHTACQAITAALFARERGAGGQHIELSMLDSAVAFLFADAAAHEVALDNDQPHLSQSFSAHQRAIAFADGHAVVAAVTDSEFHGMARAFGVDSSDPGLATMGDRQRNRPLTSAVFRAVHTAATAMPLDEAIEAMDRCEVPFGVVLGLEDVATDAQAVHNELFTEHDHPMMGRGPPAPRAGSLLGHASRAARAVLARPRPAHRRGSGRAGLGRPDRRTPGNRRDRVTDADTDPARDATK